jgi:hypothetical protein
MWLRAPASWRNSELQVAAADAIHDIGELEDRPGDRAGHQTGQQQGDTEGERRGGEGEALTVPDVGEEIGLRRSCANHPHLIVADAKGRGGGEIVGAIVNELEPLERLRCAARQCVARDTTAKRIDDRIGSIGEGEQFAGRSLVFRGDDTLSRVGQECLVGGAHEEPRIRADGESGHKTG